MTTGMQVLCPSKAGILAGLWFSNYHRSPDSTCELFYREISRALDNAWAVPLETILDDIVRVSKETGFSQKPDQMWLEFIRAFFDRENRKLVLQLLGTKLNRDFGSAAIRRGIQLSTRR